MASLDRALARGTRRGERTLQELGDLVREARVGAGLSQTELGKAARMSAPPISRVERGKLRTLSIVQASCIASVLGMDLRVNAYPGGDPLRDSAHAERLRRVLEHVRPPLRYRVDVPLPRREDGPPELRGWDAVLYGHGQRTAVELEMRIRDVQAMIRRHAMKRRDDPVEGFLLVLADTHTKSPRAPGDHQALPGPASAAHQPRACRAQEWRASTERDRHDLSGIVMI